MLIDKKMSGVNRKQVVTGLVVIYSLKGRINFIGQIRGPEDPIYKKMSEEFQHVFWEVHR